MTSEQSQIAQVQATGMVPKQPAAITLLMIIFAVITIIGIAFGIHSFIAGHEQVYGTSREVPWGILIATYVFFVVTSTGLCIVSSIGHVFGFKQFEPIVVRAVFLSIVTIISGFLVIAFEIENSWRMVISYIVGANLNSNIWWMGTLYGLYLLFMILEFILLLKRRHCLARYMGIAGLLSGIAAHSNLGAVFGLLNGREFWHGPYMPIYFIASAALSGAVTIILFSLLACKVNKQSINKVFKNSLSSVAQLATFMFALLLFFTIWKMLAGITGHPPGKYEAMQLLLTGPYALNFWVGEIALGMVIPFIIMLKTQWKNLKALFIASLLAFIGIFMMRYDLVIVGQLIPHLHGMGLVDYPVLYSYTPSLHEVMVTLSGFTFLGFFFLLGEHFFHRYFQHEPTKNT